MQVAKTNYSRLHVRFFNLAPRASGKSPTKRSLKVAELDNGDRRIGLTSEMARLFNHTVHQ